MWIVWTAPVLVFFGVTGKVMSNIITYKAVVLTPRRDVSETRKEGAETNYPLFISLCEKYCSCFVHTFVHSIRMTKTADLDREILIT